MQKNPLKDICISKIMSQASPSSSVRKSELVKTLVYLLML